MKGAKSPKQDRPDEQKRRFIETARALGCDDDEAAFKAKLAVIARQKPKDEMVPASANPQANSPEKVRVTKLPARRAKGALSAVDWSASRIGMRDKAQRVGETKRQATKRLTKPVAPGTKR